jgi:hypothetical protein
VKNQQDQYPSPPTTNAGKTHEHHEDHGHGMVPICINDTPSEVRQGRPEVATMSKIDDIPTIDVIYNVPEYALLPNNGFVVVHRGERF